ncbi:MarR family winged helix-turn-helix transcriptional regulator [Spelaeicoccus albus]|uniref:DNA-binding MarR family transcriptional regulator n=1 Tax=Spelaeicoccus albus TaxID=1280376 RepID=A0A7Z0A9Z2_9MICO|nr:MarR family transcriptional regulator [Spelaeicoccus albus]NYI67129.1 DNA-binding MarR family transcriptional regulator [Spelaeicoccus albus]
MIDRQRAGEVLSEVVELVRVFRVTGQHRRDRTISGTKIGVLRQIQDEDLRLGELAHRLRVSAPVVSRAVDSLEEEALVRRRTDDEDARACLIAITDRGRESVAARERYVADVFAEAMPEWSADDAERAISVLRELRVNVAELVKRLDSADNDSPPDSDHPA